MLWPPARLLVCVIASALAPVLAEGQQQDLLPGDSVRFVEVRSIAWQGDDGRVLRSTEERFPYTGKLVGIQADTVRVMVESTEMRFGLGELEDLEVWLRPADFRGRAMKEGAITGAAVVGGVALALAICNPSWWGEEDGCLGPESVGSVAKFTLAGAAIGAVALGSVAALLASSSVWESVDPFQVGVGPGPSGATSFAFRMPAVW